MDTTRRGLLVGAGAASLAGLAGCADLDAGFITGEEPAEFVATPATVAEAAVDDAGYELHRVEETVVTREFEAAGQSREVEVTNATAEYDRAVELLGERRQAAVFTVLTTPQVDVLGRTFNPVDDMERDDLAELVQERYDSVEDVEHESEYDTELLGEDVDVGRYSADGRIAGTEVTVDLVLHVTDPVDSGDDFVVGFGAYPELVDDGDAVRRLLAGVEHGTE
jgi:hypothetical protein